MNLLSKLRSADFIIKLLDKLDKTIRIRPPNKRPATKDAYV